MKSNRILLPVLAAVLLALAASAGPTDPLEARFLNPPDSAKPQTWWHWINGNITKVGLTAAAKAGANNLVVKITNLWPNRLIGDEQLLPDVEWNGKQLASWPQWLLDGKPSPTGRLTFTTWHHWTKNDAPLESGLLGPVTLRTAEIISAN